MSKYDPLWQWINKNGTDQFKLSYDEIGQILGFNIDHSFLTYKRELIDFGFEVKKISMKDQLVTFEKIK